MDSEPKSLQPHSVDVRAFNPSLISDVTDLFEANKYQDMDSITTELLPNCGYVAYQDDTCIAAGFLRLVEGKCGLMDSYVSNPEITSEVRHIALDLITKSIIEAAKGMKLKGIFAFSSDKGIRLRAEATGFQLVDQSFYALRLESNG